METILLDDFLDNGIIREKSFREMVDKLADFYEDEVSTSVKSLTSILEPLMIVFVALVVAFILIAMYLPMFNMMSTVN